MKITKQSLQQLNVGQSVTITNTDKAHTQRIRNYAFSAKSDTKDYTVKTSGNNVTVTCIDATTPTRIVDQLNAMQIGEVIHPAHSRHRDIIENCSRNVDGEFKIETVVQIVRIK